MPILKLLQQNKVSITTMKHILVTGSQGFIGKNLTRALQAEGCLVTEFMGDFTDIQHVNAFLDSTPTFELTYHFAGISSPTKCLENKTLALKTNTIAVAELAKKISNHSPGSGFIFPSTGQVYSSKSFQPLTEATPLEPINFYAETKLQAEQALQMIPNLDIGILRLFNHTHKSQDPHFFLPSLHHQILAGFNPVKTGNLDIIRDFGALQDLLKALVILAAQNLPTRFEIYNICSGTGKKLRTLAEELATRLGKKVDWVTDTKILRRDEPLKILGSSEKFQNQFGWHPIHARNEQELIASFLEEIPVEKGTPRWPV